MESHTQEGGGGGVQCYPFTFSLVFYLLVSDQGFVFMIILLILSIKNFFEILEIEKTSQNSFDRYARTFKSRYSGLNRPRGVCHP